MKAGKYSDKQRAVDEIVGRRYLDEISHGFSSTLGKQVRRRMNSRQRFCLDVNMGYFQAASPKVLCYVSRIPTVAGSVVKVFKSLS